MAQRANLEEISHPLHEAYSCLLDNGLNGAGEVLRILVKVVLAYRARPARRLGQGLQVQDQGHAHPHV